MTRRTSIPSPAARTPLESVAVDGGVKRGLGTALEMGLSEALGFKGVLVLAKEAAWPGGRTRWKHFFPTIVSAGIVATAPLSTQALAAAQASVPAPTEVPNAVAFVGATVWDGTGSDPVPGTTIVVDGGLIHSVSTTGGIPEGARIVMIEGKYVIPGLIDAHAHVTGRWAEDDGGEVTGRVLEDLELFAAYGVTTVNSLGDGFDVLEARSELSGRAGAARLLASGPVITARDPQAARETAREVASAGADWLKVRVDDNLGTVEKMPWPAVEAVIDVGMEAGIGVATHIFYLEDAKRALQVGARLIAHSVRDTEVDDEFVAAMAGGEACYIPTLTREVSTFVYGQRPGFFDEEFFTARAKSSEVERLSDSTRMASVRASPAAQRYRVALVQALENLTTLVEAGVPIAFGTDAGPAGRFPGFFEHMELALMVGGAGLTPMQALRTATGVAAECLGLGDVGTLEVGKRADFLVLGSDPFRDITNTKTLEQVYIGGEPVLEEREEGARAPVPQTEGRGTRAPD